MALPGELQRPLLLFHIEVYQHKKEPRTFLAYLYIAMTDERHVERTVQAIRLDVGTGPKGFHQQGRRRRTLRLGGTPLHSISMDVIYHGNFQYPMKDEKGIRPEDVTYGTEFHDLPAYKTMRFEHGMGQPSPFVQLKCRKNGEMLATFEVALNTGDMGWAIPHPVQVADDG